MADRTYRAATSEADRLTATEIHQIETLVLIFLGHADPARKLAAINPVRAACPSESDGCWRRWRCRGKGLQPPSYL